MIKKSPVNQCSQAMVKDTFNYIALIGNGEKNGCDNGLSGKHSKQLNYFSIRQKYLPCFPLPQLQR